jgi:hypothetical protein
MSYPLITKLTVCIDSCTDSTVVLSRVCIVVEYEWVCTCNRLQLLRLLLLQRIQRYNNQSRVLRLFLDQGECLEDDAIAEAGHFCRTANVEWVHRTTHCGLRSFKLGISKPKGMYSHSASYPDDTTTSIVHGNKIPSTSPVNSCQMATRIPLAFPLENYLRMVLSSVVTRRKSTILK